MRTYCRKYLLAMELLATRAFRTSSLARVYIRRLSAASRAQPKTQSLRPIMQVTFGFETHALQLTQWIRQCIEFGIADSCSRVTRGHCAVHMPRNIRQKLDDKFAVEWNGWNCAKALAENEVAIRPLRTTSTRSLLTDD